MSEEPSLFDEWIDEIGKNLLLAQDAPLLLAEVEQLYEEKGAMLKHIDDLENALTNIFTLWFELADSSDITEAMRHHLNNFAYLYTEPTDEEE